MNTPAHRVIFTYGGGRFGNQVLRFLHWMAWAREHAAEVEVLNLAFWPFAPFFDAWRGNPGCVFPSADPRVNRLARWAGRVPRLRRTWSGRQRVQRAVQSAGHWMPGWQAIDRDVARGERVDLDDPAVLAEVRRRRVTTCCGWEISSWRLIEKHGAALRGFFRPAAEFDAAAAAFVDKLRQRHDLLIGVFIRQSDYRVWNDGRFHFQTKRYAEWLRQLLALHPEQRVAFVVASEEQQDPACLAGLPCYFASGSVNAGGHWFASWAELSRCDLIVTPPSTFSATAAFVGGIPLWPVVSADQNMRPDQRIVDGITGAARHAEFRCAVK